MSFGGTEPSEAVLAPVGRVGQPRGRRIAFERWRAADWAALVSAAFILLLLVVGVFAPLIAPYGQGAGNLTNAFAPPVGLGGTWDHPLGTDELGRDVLSRLMFGARVSLIIGLGAVSLSVGLGVIVGIFSAYFGGVVDAILMRLVEAQWAFPTIVLALILAAALGPGTLTVFIAVLFVYWAYVARVARGETLRVKEADFVALARVAGASHLRIARRHLFPNIMNTMVVLLTLLVASGVTFEASLSFLGLGIQPPQASWGTMLGVGRGYIRQAWWLSVMPGMAIFLTVLALNMFGDWLRDYFDPKKQRLA